MVNLYQGDCLEEMGKVADHSVDMIFTDLLYGTTHNEGGHGTALWAGKEGKE